MRSFIMRRLSPALLSASLVATGFVGCSDDDDDDTVTNDGGRDSGTGSDAGGDAGSNIDGGGTLLDASLDGSTGGDAAVPVAAVVAVNSKAADLRVTIDLLLSEHMVLAAKATGAALGGDARKDEFAAYGALLAKNGTDVGELVGTAYGVEAKTSFNAIWTAHNNQFVEYTKGVAANNQTQKDNALAALRTTYVNDFSALVAGATMLPLDAVKGLTLAHVEGTKKVIDAQGAQMWTVAYTELRAAIAHMQMLGDPLAKAVAAKLPANFPGDPAAKSVDFRVKLNAYLQEHLYLASFATSAAIGGRTAEFDAAGAALNANGTDIGKAIEALYDKATADAFNGIWAGHNGYFVAYTTAAAAVPPNEPGKMLAVMNLTTVYVPRFSELLASATGTAATVWTPEVANHVNHTKAIVDAQVTAKATVGPANAKAVGDLDLTGGKHMQNLGDPLAKGIVAKIPAKF